MKRLTFALLALCLAGCGQEAGTEASESAPDAVREEAAWKENGFAEAQEVGEGQELWAKEYTAVSWADPQPEGEIRFHFVTEEGECAGKLCRLHEYNIEGLNRPKQYLEVYDAASGESSLYELTPEKMGIGADADYEGNYFQIIDADLLADGSFALLFDRLGTDENGNSGHAQISIVRTRLDKTAAEITDVRELFLEKGIFENTYEIPQIECFYDADGHSYVVSGNSENPLRELYVLNASGELLVFQKYGELEQIQSPVRTEEGELIFPVYDRQEKRLRFFRFDAEASALREAGEMTEQDYRGSCGLWENGLYYISSKGIVRWDIESGERALVFSYEGNGVNSAYQTMLFRGSDGIYRFRMYGEISGKTEDWIAELGGEQISKKDAVRVVSLTDAEVKKVVNCAAVSARRNPNYSYVFEARGEEPLSDYRDRIIAELMAGEGPDILYLSREDFALLAEKGLLSDLGSVLTENFTGRLLPGALGLGTAEGKLYGLPADVSVETLVTLKDIRQEETWTLEEMLDLMESGEFDGLICQGEGGFAPRALLRFMTEYGVNSSVLIDWEKKECHFEDEIFLRILKAAKKYGEADPQPGKKLGKGETLADVLAGSSLNQMNTLYEKYGENYFFVGVPTDGGNGNFLQCDGIVAVNKNVVDTAAVSYFFEMLADEEIQELSSGSSRLSICRISEDSSYYREQDGAVFWNGVESIRKEDGTTTLQDWSSFLEQCVPAPIAHEDLSDIIWEEAQGYFEGDKSAEAVAEIIQNRIQLYLDEK